MARTEEGETATAQVLRDSYLPGDGRMKSEVTSQMVRLFTDLHFLAPIDKVGLPSLILIDDKHSSGSEGSGEHN